MEVGKLMSRCGPRCPAFSPARATGGGRPHAKAREVAARAGEEPASSRRCLLGVGLLMAVPVLAPHTAEAVESNNGGEQRRGIARYIRKKKLDPLDTYVPAVVAARKQLKRAGEIMRDDLQGARDLLREGAFDGLRDNIRALGEYAEQGGTKDAKKLVDGFFAASQAFDYTLFQAKRKEQPVGQESDEKLDGAIAALDRLLATVPADILEQSEKIVAAVEEYYSQPQQPLAVPEPSQEQSTGQEPEQQQPAPGRKLDELIQLVPG